MPELKKIPIDAGRFPANGKIYIIETMFSIERYALYQRLQLEAGFGTSFDEMIKAWQKVETYANKLLFNKISVLAYNMQKGVTKINEREPVMLKMCALFINEEHEDRRDITDDMISTKISDWKVEGYAIEDFFTLALNTINGFIDNYKRITQVITELNGLPQQSSIQTAKETKKESQ